MSPADIYSRIMGYLSAGNQRSEEAVLAPYIGKYPHVSQLGAQQQLRPGCVIPYGTEQERGLADVYLAYLRAGLGGELYEFRLGKDSAALDLDERRRYIEFLLNVKTAGVGVPVKSALGVDPILAETALNLYAFAVGRRGAHDCCLANDPLLDGLPLLLVQKLLQIAELLHGRCVLTTESKQLLGSFLDIASAPHYNNSAECYNQNGPTGGKEWDGFTNKTG